MDQIKEIMRKRLSIQHRGKNMIGSISLNEIKSYLKIEKIEVLNGPYGPYIKYNKKNYKIPKWWKDATDLNLEDCLSIIWITATKKWTKKTTKSTTKKKAIAKKK